MDKDILYCADHHFLHEQVIDWCNRPFSGVEEMTDYLIQQHNAVAERSTEVYILGDFALGRNTAEMRRIFDRMNGRKHLIVGNHDKKDVLRLPWSSDPKVRTTVNDNGRFIFLDHLAVHSWPGMFRGTYHFYGHTHGKLPSRGRSIDVGVDSWDFTPVRADDAIARMHQWNSDFETYAPERKEIIDSPDTNLPPGYYRPELREDPAYDGPSLRR